MIFGNIKLALLASLFLFSCTAHKVADPKGAATSTVSPGTSPQNLILTRFITAFLNTEFEISTKTQDIPKNLFPFFKKKYGKFLLIAPPGAYFNDTDMIWKDEPNARLVFGSKRVQHDMGFLVYEYGGGVRTRKLCQIYILQKNKVKTDLIILINQEVTNYEELKNLIKINEYTIL